MFCSKKLHLIKFGFAMKNCKYDHLERSRIEDLAQLVMMLMLFISEKHDVKIYRFGSCRRQKEGKCLIGIYKFVIQVI